ncbi:MAG: NAD-dependent epimerase/dehydratase family protein [Candidatus Aminicenantaceae bacterium]
MPQKALVTGASGFTGYYLVQNLIAHDYDVRALVRSTSKIDKLRQLPVTIFFGDIRSEREVEMAMEDADIVFHIAALYRAANVPDAEYWAVNAHGTENVLKAALKKGVKRLVHCSTAGVYGHVENPPGDENSPFNPGDVYQESKLEGEKIAFFYYREKSLPVTVVRPTGIYGPGDFRMLKMYRMIQNGKFIIFGSGNVFYHLTYVKDTVEGFRLAGENPQAVGKAYIIAGDEYITLNQFTQTIAKELSVPAPSVHLPVLPLYITAFIVEKLCVPLRIQPPIFRRRLDIFTKDRAFDCSKAKRELGYRPKVGYVEGIHKTVKWYITEGLLKKIKD